MRRLVNGWTRRWLAPAVACCFSAVAIGSVALLQAAVNHSRDAQLKLANVQTVLNALQAAPFKANAQTGGSPEYARRLIDGDEATIDTTLHGLEDDGPAVLRRLAGPLAANYAILERIYRLGITQQGYDARADRLAAIAGGQQGAIVRLLGVAMRGYDGRVDRAQSEALFGSALVIVGLLAAFGFFYRRSGQAVAGLRQAQRDRDRLLARTVEVAEHERIRVAHEIHDVPIQQLTAVALNLDRFERKLASGDVGGAGELAGAVREDTASVISSLRRLMVELRPPILDERGLVPSLRDCANEMFAGSATTYQVEGATFATAHEVETVLYRIAREALANAAKHAGATRVDISLGALDDELVLTIEDDGRGFDELRPSARPGATRFGILGMRERAESLGGELHVLSTRGAGTRVEARLPWKPRVERDQRAAA
jgi:signal transduction histidine kinase